MQNTNNQWDNDLNCGRIAPTRLAKMLKLRIPVTIMPLMPPVLYRIVNIIGHFVTCVGHEILPFLRFAFAEQPDGSTGSEGSSKGG